MSVTVESLTKNYAGSRGPAVESVDFTAPTGAITTLLGPSGAGKSTVLRLIAGLESPDAGKILIEDSDVTCIPVQRRQIGFVFQNYALFQNMSVRSNVAFGLEVRRVPRAEIQSRVDELLRLIQLEDLASRYPGQLSGGQRQRVAFARALAPRPKVLLLDEPFGALDTKVRGELRDWLHRLHEETKVTTIMVTHDQDEALELSEQIVVMQNGTVVQAAAPHEVYDHPASPFVARFVGGASEWRGSVNGQLVQGLVRPHDVKLLKPSSTSSLSAHARIRQVKRIGSQVRVALEVPNGNKLVVHMTLAEFQALAVVEGDIVIADLDAAKIFVEDYVI